MRRLFRRYFKSCSYLTASTDVATSETTNVDHIREPPYHTVQDTPSSFTGPSLTPADLADLGSPSYVSTLQLNILLPILDMATSTSGSLVDTDSLSTGLTPSFEEGSREQDSPTSEDVYDQFILPGRRDIVFDSKLDISSAASTPEVALEPVPSKKASHILENMSRMNISFTKPEMSV